MNSRFLPDNCSSTTQDAKMFLSADSDRDGMGSIPSGIDVFNSDFILLFINQ